MIYPEASILSVFKNLIDSGFRWILLRNTDDLLPDKLPLGKDIDILINKDDYESLIDFLKNKNYKVLKNPLERNERWYGVSAPAFLRSPDGVLIDIACEIFVMSPHRNILIPLDQEIQSSAWKNALREKFGTLSVEVLSAEDLFVSLASRCIFDKRKFGVWQQKKLKNLLDVVDEESLKKKLRLVFFNFAPILIQRIKHLEFELILSDYFSFKDY